MLIRILDHVLGTAGSPPPSLTRREFQAVCHLAYATLHMAQASGALGRGSARGGAGVCVQQGVSRECSTTHHVAELLLRPAS